LSSLPLIVSGGLLIVGTIALALGGLFVSHRVLKFRRYLVENEVAGFLYAVIGVTYGVLLAFVVLVVWQQYAAADQAITTEAADLVAVFRDTQTFPAPLRQNAQVALRAYADEVMTTEWQTHGQLLPHHAPDPLNLVWSIYRAVRPRTAWDVAQQANAEEHLYVLEQQRHMRHLSGEATLPPIFWPILIAGALVVIGFSYFLRVDDLRIQAAMTAVMAGLLAAVLFLIMSLNQPYTGQIHVSRYPFRHALQQFNALNLGQH
jgi:hypothetical protein